MIPLVLAADEILAVVRIPGGKLSLILVEAKVLQYVQGEVEATCDLVLDLLRSTEDVSIILGEAADAEQAVHYAGTLVAVHGAQLSQAHRQIAIGLQRVAVDQDVAGTIHGLEAIFGVVEFHGVEHVLRVIAFVARGEKQLPARNVGRVHQGVAALQIFVAHPVLHFFADDAALGVPEDQPRARQFLNGEQIELLSQRTMIALFGLVDLLQVVVEIFLREKRSSIDALQLRILLIAQPVGSGDVEQLECLDFSGGRDVRSAAEVGELTGAVDRDLFIGLGELLDEMALHEIAFFFEFGETLIPW